MFGVGLHGKLFVKREGIVNIPFLRNEGLHFVPLDVVSAEERLFEFRAPRKITGITADRPIQTAFLFRCGLACLLADLHRFTVTIDTLRCIPRTAFSRLKTLSVETPYSWSFSDPSLINETDLFPPAPDTPFRCVPFLDQSGVGLFHVPR